MNEREKHLQRWLQQSCPHAGPPVLLSGDASFRRYYRVRTEQQSYVLMDAPPERESCDTFIAIAKAFQKQGLTVPKIYKANPSQGFLLLSDFGDHVLLDTLTSNTVEDAYRKALEIVLQLQSCQTTEGDTFPLFDAPLYQAEMDLFIDWYWRGLKGRSLSSVEREDWQVICALLINTALSQPQVCVHRDYHSRNLMVLQDGRFGILDFQDAVIGPITYDLMSLVRDCYIEWPLEKVQSWVLYFQQRLWASGCLPDNDPSQFLQWCDWIALQRHLKCIGIFARLHLRDHKSAYLDSIPRVIGYVRQACQRYTEFSGLMQFLEEE